MNCCRYPSCQSPTRPAEHWGPTPHYCREHRNYRQRLQLQRDAVVQMRADRLRLAGWVPIGVPLYTISRRGFENLLASRQAVS